MPYSFMYKIPGLVRTCDDGKLYFLHRSETNHEINDDHSTKNDSENIGMLFEFLDGKTLDETIGVIHDDEVFIYLGMIVSKLSIDLLELSDVQIISDLLKARSSYRWSLSNASSATQNAIIKLENYLSISGNKELEYISTQLMEKIKQFCLVYDNMFSKDYLFRLGPLRILHGDLNMRNFITCDINYLKDFLQESNYKNDVPALGIIDWQDIQVGPRIFDLAIFITYVLTELLALKRLGLDSERIGTLVGYIKFGYELIQQEKLPTTLGDTQLRFEELDALIMLITIRLCQSVCLAQIGLLESSSSQQNSHIVDGLVERIDLLKSMLEHRDEMIENIIIQIALQVDQSLTISKKDMIKKKYL